MTFNEISYIFERSENTEIDTMTEMSYLENALKEIECNLSYLEDAPDEILMPFNDRFDGICERLRTLDEYLHHVKVIAKI